MSSYFIIHYYHKGFIGHFNVSLYYEGKLVGRWGANIDSYYKTFITTINQDCNIFNDPGGAIICNGTETKKYYEGHWEYKIDSAKIYISDDEFRAKYNYLVHNTGKIDWDMNLRGDPNSDIGGTNCDELAFTFMQLGSSHYRSIFDCFSNEQIEKMKETFAGRQFRDYFPEIGYRYTTYSHHTKELYNLLDPNNYADTASQLSYWTKKSDDIPWIDYPANSLGNVDQVLIDSALDAITNGEEYEVKSGDTLWDIGAQSGLTQSELLEYNQWLIDEDRVSEDGRHVLLKPGDVISLSPNDESQAVICVDSNFLNSYVASQGLASAESAYAQFAQGWSLPEYDPYGSNWLSADIYKAFNMDNALTGGMASGMFDKYTDIDAFRSGPYSLDGLASDLADDYALDNFSNMDAMFGLSGRV